MSNKVVVTALTERPPLNGKVRCKFNSEKVKTRKGVYFGKVTKDGKTIREEGYMLIQDEPKHKYVDIPRK